MATLNWDRRGLGALLRSEAIQAACVAKAQPEAARMAAATPRDSGNTAGSTRVEPADFGDRKGAMIVQDGASVAQNWGNARTPAKHYAVR